MLNRDINKLDLKIQENLRKKLIEKEITPSEFFAKHKKRSKIFKVYLLDNLKT